MNIDTFIGRNRQLAGLKRLLQRRTASLVVIRGRRRVGKSRLVEEFAKDLTYYKFEGLAPTKQTTAQSQREEFARQLSHYFGLPGLKADDWGDLFSLLAKHTEQGRVVILFDEITWMASLDPTFLGKLKIAWDNYFSKNPNLILILCGSISTWIEKNILSSTLFFGRIKHKIILEELSLPHCNDLLKVIGFRGSIFEKFMLLSMTGGIPWYIELIDPSLSAVENIQQLCFVEDGILVDEFDNIFHDLFGRNNNIYKDIISTLSLGPVTYKELSERIDYPSGGPLTEYVNNLILSGYITKDYSWSIKSSKELSLYKLRLSDNYMRFYLKYISPNYQKITKGRFQHYSVTDLAGWDTIMGYQFENLVLNNRNILLEKLNISPSHVVYDNPYFQRETKSSRGCQIDYLIQTKFNTLYLCEVKFSKNPVGMNIVNEVEQKIAALNLPKTFSVLPVLIHINGATEGMATNDFFAHIVDFGELLEN
ncbi:MAG: ATPase [Legionellales bacterium]|nr:ATPase [Legionellales bacterium]